VKEFGSLTIIARVKEMIKEPLLLISFYSIRTERYRRGYYMPLKYNSNATQIRLKFHMPVIFIRGLQYGTGKS